MKDTSRLSVSLLVLAAVCAAIPGLAGSVNIHGGSTTISDSTATGTGTLEIDGDPRKRQIKAGVSFRQVRSPAVSPTVAP